MSVPDLEAAARYLASLPPGLHAIKSTRERFGLNHRNMSGVLVLASGFRAEAYRQAADPAGEVSHASQG